MAEFRTIHSKMWRDSWFTELDCEGKLLWIYLITNHAASLTGIYYMTVKFASFETGLGQERVQTLLAQFVLSGKIEYENDVVWIRRMRKYQASNESSPKIKPRIEKDLSEIPDCKVKRLYIAQYPIDNVSIPTHTDTDTDTDTETDTEGRSIANAKSPAKPRIKRQPDERTATPAIQACYKTVGRFPPLGMYDRLIGALGNAPEIQRLTECRTAWLERGYNPNAWTWATDWYMGGIPSRNGDKSRADKFAIADQMTRERLAQHGESW